MFPLFGVWPDTGENRQPDVMLRLRFQQLTNKGRPEWTLKSPAYIALPASRDVRETMGDIPAVREQCIELLAPDLCRPCYNENQRQYPKETAGI